MCHARIIPILLLFGALTSVLLAFEQLAMFIDRYIVQGLFWPSLGFAAVDFAWHRPQDTWINDMTDVINGPGVWGFVFDSSENPLGVAYGTYNWCNMPHVRPQEYAVASEEYELQYVEVIHRHHKRTPYAANTFPIETEAWYCNDEGLFYYGQPLDAEIYAASSTYWNISSGDINPFKRQGFNGSCVFPQITREGLEDSWHHGKDLYAVYHDLLGFIPDRPDSKVSFRVTTNVITSQVAGMVIAGMFGEQTSYPLHVQPSDIDSLEPAYACPSSTSLFDSYGSGSNATGWLAHIIAASPLYEALDTMSGISSNNSEWHKSFDHYFDNLSARQCHAKQLPCNTTSNECVSQSQADGVYRLGEYEYSYIYRDNPNSLSASVASFGVWIAELAQNIRDNIDGRSNVVYRHNVAHDGSISRLLSILQLNIMVWPGMGAEVVFEIYRKKEANNYGSKHYVRVLWGGQVFVSSNPTLGWMDMLDLDVLLAYFDGLVGKKASKIVELCNQKVRTPH